MILLRPFNRRPALPLAALLAFAPLAGCNQNSKPASGAAPAAAKTGKPLATGEGVQVTVDDFTQRLKEQPPMVRGSYTSLERKKELLNQLVDSEVLVAQARKQGLDKDPEVQQTIDRLLMQRLLRDQKSKATPTAPPSDEELKQFYEAQKAQYVTPETVRVAQIFLAAPENSPQRNKRDAEVKAMALKAKSAKTDAAFAELAKKLSEDPTKATGGDLSFRIRSQLEAQYGKAFATTAFALTQPGQVSAVVESPRGYHMIRMLERRPEHTAGLEELKPQLVARLTRQRQDDMVKGYVKKLREDAHISVDEAELTRIDVAKLP